MSELKTCFKKVDYDLSGLLHYIEIGDIGLPDIQRPFVWSNAKVRREFRALGVTVGGSRAGWLREQGLPSIHGDRDIMAFHQEKRACVIAEVEGESTGQPEQKLDKAIGQLVMAASTGELSGWKQMLVLVVYGDQIAKHLGRANALRKLGIPALVLSDDCKADQWPFSDALLPIGAAATPTTTI